MVRSSLRGVDPVNETSPPKASPVCGVVDLDETGCRCDLMADGVIGLLLGCDEPAEASMLKASGVVRRMSLEVVLLTAEPRALS